jgi:hypothetical protein
MLGDEDRVKEGALWMIIMNRHNTEIIISADRNKACTENLNMDEKKKRS